MCCQYSRGSLIRVVAEEIAEKLKHVMEEDAGQIVELSEDVQLNPKNAADDLKELLAKAKQLKKMVSKCDVCSKEH